MNATDAERILGHRVRVRSSDLGYDGLEGRATGIATNFGPALQLDVDGQRWTIGLDDITSLTALRHYLVAVNRKRVRTIFAESDNAALAEAQKRAGSSPGEVFEVWRGSCLVGWATADATGEAS